ncbi:hypothetical protein LWI28_021313 [Acer negundo]|uniref:Uncharacterized protein n=1 Tax=Acer negundo TaxID=4023 RepID=A0AAD5IGG7_ACENE|nr:hypothetical protein LWI28_021313 [Acer negundo]
MVAEDGVDERCGRFGERDSNGKRGGDLFCSFLFLQRRQERCEATVSSNDSARDGISLSSSSLLHILLLLPLQVSLICQQILTFDFFLFQG